MGTYFLWRLGMVLVVILAFTLFVALYNAARKMIHKFKKKESGQ